MSRVTIQGQGNGKTVLTEEGATLLDALRQVGVGVLAPCGGNGTCGKCRVKYTQNGVTREVLACRTRVAGDCVITVPETACLFEERELEASCLCDFAGKGYGAAVDLGTTTVAVRLYALRDGRQLGEEQAFNAQMTWGADVLSRVQYIIEHQEGLELLGKTIRRQTASLLEKLCASCGIHLPQVETLCLAGNTIMEHIFLGLDPSGMAVSPFYPQTLFDQGRRYRVAEFGETEIIPAPCVSAFVGGDITAGLMAAGLDQRTDWSLFLDVGTNGEMALRGTDGFLCCSVACGPALEGAEISCGMTSGPGAIRHITWERGRLCMDIVGEGPPKGICGSGLIDLLAVLLTTGVVDGTGRMLPPEEVPPNMRSYLEKDENGNGIFYLTEQRELFFSAADVRKLQLAKAAVAAGIQVLLQNADVEDARVKQLYLAGSFGDAIDPESAVIVGLFPAHWKNRVVSLGNTSLAGAEKMVLEPQSRQVLGEIQGQCRYLELSGRADFAEAFVEQMLFEMED